MQSNFELIFDILRLTDFLFAYDNLFQWEVNLIKIRFRDMYGYPSIVRKNIENYK